MMDLQTLQYLDHLNSALRICCALRGSPLLLDLEPLVPPHSQNILDNDFSRCPILGLTSLLIELRSCEKSAKEWEKKGSPYLIKNDRLGGMQNNRRGEWYKLGCRWDNMGLRWELDPQSRSECNMKLRKYTFIAPPRCSLPGSHQLQTCPFQPNEQTTERHDKPSF